MVTQVKLGLNSFVALTKRFKTSTSALFARATITSQSIDATLLAVLNYSPESSDTDSADWGDHRVLYGFPMNMEFMKWFRVNSQAMDQADFAQFCEDNAADMGVATAADFPDGFFGSLDPAFARPTDVIQVSRGLEIRSEETVQNVVRLSSGETKIAFGSEHKDVQGGVLSVPEWFTLRLPIFEGGERVLLPVRLRYRKKGACLIWFFELFRLEKIFRDHVADCVVLASAQTELPLFMGAPEQQ